MSDQYPVSPPPPAYAPGPPASGYPPVPPTMPGGMPPAPPKKKTGLIIALVVGVLLLCCCLAAAAGALFFIPTDSTTTSDSDGGLGTLPSAQSDPRIAEWLAWDPSGPAMLEAPPSSMEPFMNEGVAELAPALNAQEAVWSPGYYDSAEDWYYADAVFVRATHPSSKSVSATIEMWIQSDQMLAEDVPFEPRDDEILVTVADGARQLVYWSQWGDGFAIDTEDDVALWRQIGEDWPDSLVVQRESDDGQYVIEITKWDLYAVPGDYPYVSATYEQSDGAWSLVEWQYHEVEDEATTSS